MRCLENATVMISRTSKIIHVLNRCVCLFANIVVSKILIVDLQEGLACHTGHDDSPTFFQQPVVHEKFCTTVVPNTIVFDVAPFRCYFSSICRTVLTLHITDNFVPKTGRQR